MVDLTCTVVSLSAPSLIVIATNPVLFMYSIPYNPVHKTCWGSQLDGLNHRCSWPNFACLTG